MLLHGIALSLPPYTASLQVYQNQLNIAKEDALATMNHATHAGSLRLRQRTSPAMVTLRVACLSQKAHTIPSKTQRAL